MTEYCVQMSHGSSAGSGAGILCFACGLCAVEPRGCETVRLQARVHVARTGCACERACVCACQCVCGCAR
eukprot:2750806-Pleurochrysis_carterae.AAC.1